MDLKLKIEQAINDCAVTAVVKDIDEKYCIPPIFFPKLRDMMIKIACDGKEPANEASGLSKHEVKYSEVRAEGCKATDAWRKCKSWKIDFRCLNDCPLHLQT